MSMEMLDGMITHPSVVYETGTRGSVDYFSFFESTCDLALLLRKRPDMFGDVSPKVIKELKAINDAVMALRHELRRLAK